jgi:hypothetical protein
MKKQLSDKRIEQIVNMELAGRPGIDAGFLAVFYAEGFGRADGMFADLESAKRFIKALQQKYPKSESNITDSLTGKILYSERRDGRL